MKYFSITLLMFLFVGCKEEKKRIYNDKFNAYFDSADYCHNRWFAEFQYGNSVKLKCLNKEANRYGDSMDVYYKLLYPNGNPYTIEKNKKMAKMKFPCE